MKKKTSIRVVYIYDYKIQLLIKENICNLQQHIVPLFLEQLLSVRDINKLPQGSCHIIYLGIIAVRKYLLVKALIM